MQTKFADDGVEGFAGKYSTPNYGVVSYKIKISNGVAVWVFSDRRLAKDMYNIKKQNGCDVYFKERLNMFGEKFEGLTKKEIIQIIAKEHAELQLHNKRENKNG